MDEKNLTSLSEEFFGLLLQLHKKMIKPEEFMKGLPIPPSHGKVIFYLAQKGPSSVSSIAKDLCISKPNMTPIIDKLLEEGLVNRYEDPKDRRVLRVEVTLKAHDLFKHRREYAMSCLKSRISTLNDDDLASLSKVILEFNRILGNLD